MPTIALVRPGCTDFDDQKRIQGILDLPLNQRGECQVQEITNVLRTVPLEVVYTSPGEPARSTAETIANELDVSLKPTEGLRNLDHGLWQGLAVDEIRRKFPKVFKQWKESPENICPPEGEEVSQAIQRVEKLLQKTVKRKKTFALVASEPLATLVSCLIRGDNVEFSKSCCSDCDTPLVEIIETDDNGTHLKTTSGLVLSGNLTDDSKSVTSS